MFKKKIDKESFMYYVEMHERAWGIESYPNRPSLEQILQSPVVVFWYPEKRKQVRHTITLHPDLIDLHRHISSLVLRSRIQLPDKRLARLFVRQRQVRIKGIKLILEGVESAE